MKKIYFFTVLLLHIISFAQGTMQVVGKNLTTASGQNFIMRGVNYPLINQGNISLSDAASYQFYIDEVAKTGANTIRIPWYTNGQNWRDIPASGGTAGTVNSYVTNGHLSNIIAYCITKNMVPILSIHDDSFITCKTGWTHFNTAVMNFWTSPAVLNLIETNKAHIIINLANEFDYVRWTGNQTTALNTYRTNYNAAIATIRNAGVNVPIMIDAPDCGQSSTELLSIAESMNLVDTRQNLIFSSHTYWGGYASTLAQVQNKLNEAQNTNVCFVLGEVAKNQDNNSCGDLDLSTLYPMILTEACSRNIGWLAWSFNLDCSPARQMTTDGTFNNLTAFGNDIVYNSIYGLKSTNGCGATLSTDGFNLNDVSVSIYPNPSNGTFSVSTKNIEISNIKAFDVLGNEVEIKETNKNQFSIDKTGIYFIRINADNNKSILKKIIVAK